MTDLTADKARRLWDYNPATGILRWNSRPLSDFATKRAGKIWNTRFAGAEAGCIFPTTGYRHVGLAARQYPSHRLIWLITHGKFPPAEIDHINGERLDNRISNLRAVTSRENSRNAARPQNNTSGTVGVTWHRLARKWHAHIRVNGRRRHLGYYADIEDAIAARRSAEVEENFHPNHGREPTFRKLSEYIDSTSPGSME